MFKHLIVLMVVTAGCGGGGEDPVDAASTADAELAFALSSATLVDGEVFPVQHTCDGADISPALSWSGAPASTQGFAVALTDTSINLVHSVIWDIPASVSALSEDIAKVAEPSEPAGSKQSLAFDGATRGYLGPCPPSLHHYRVTVFAVGEYPLSGVTLDSSADQVKTVLLDDALVTAWLSADYGG